MWNSYVLRSSQNSVSHLKIYDSHCVDDENGEIRRPNNKVVSNIFDLEVEAETIVTNICHEQVHGNFQLILMKDGLFGTMKDAQEGAKLQWYVVDCPKPGFIIYES